MHGENNDNTPSTNTNNKFIYSILTISFLFIIRVTLLFKATLIISLLFKLINYVTIYK